MIRISRLPVSVLLLTGLAFPQASPAFQYSSPQKIEGVTTIDAEGVVDLARASDSLLIIDSRLGIDHEKGYIEGSVNLVDSETNCESLGALSPKTDTPMVFYCNGVNCDRSDIAVKIARDCGYERLYWFRGGVEEWQAKQFPLVR